jgi:hypothetical protein
MSLNELNGKYRARAVESGLGKASTGTEQVAVKFQLLDENLSIVWYGYFSDKTYERTVESLRSCGWKGSDPTELDNFATSGLGAEEVELVIEQETSIDQSGGQGTRARVRWVNKPGAGGIGLKAKMEPDEAKSFAARMKAKILAMEQGKPKASPPRSPSRQPEPPPHTDSDRPPF